LSIFAKQRLAIAASFALLFGISGHPRAWAQPQQSTPAGPRIFIVSEEPEPAPNTETMESSFDSVYRNAVALYRQKKYPNAISEFQNAYSIKPTPRLLFNIAQCYRKQDQFAEGIEYFDKYLAQDANISPEVRAEVQAYKAELEAKIQAQAAPARRKVIMIATEKPAPRRFLPFGVTTGVLGLGVLAVGASFIGIDGKCVDTTQLPALECNRLFNSATDGVVLSAVGGSIVVLGAVFIGISARRPHVTQKTELASSLYLNAKTGHLGRIFIKE